MSERGQSVESQIRELKVSGHTMSLEPGIYCVYNAPGGPVAGSNGLPGVRISAAPGSHRGRVNVAGFTTDGWIGADSAALVSVTDGAADLLVTVYLPQDGAAEAPKLQVVRLSGEAAATAPQAQPPQAAAPKQAAAAAPAQVQVVAHIYGRGDVGGQLGEWMGEAGSQRWIEGFGIAPSDGIAASDIEYQAVLGRGWLSPWSEGGQFCGSRGMSLPILGVRIRLKGQAAKTHRVVLSATFVDGTKVGPVGDGEACEAESLAALESFHVALVPQASKPAGRAAPARAAAPAPAAAPVRGKSGPKPKAAEAPAPAAKPARKTATAPAATQAPKPAVTAKPARTPAAPAKGGTPKPTSKSVAKPASRPAANRTPPTTRRR